MKPTILLVEDSRDDELLALRALRKHRTPAELVVVRDGVEALDYLLGTGDYDGRDTRRQPHLVLLDIKLPKLNGIEVLRRMRLHPRTAFVPVVLLTSSTEERDIAEGYRNGANSYVVKPVDFDQFKEAVRELGLYWLALNTPPVADPAS